jgi:hypothetical protein
VDVVNDDFTELEKGNWKTTSLFAEQLEKAVKELLCKACICGSLLRGQGGKYVQEFLARYR